MGVGARLRVNLKRKAKRLHVVCPFHTGSAYRSKAKLTYTPPSLIGKGLGYIPQ